MSVCEYFVFRCFSPSPFPKAEIHDNQYLFGPEQNFFSQQTGGVSHEYITVPVMKYIKDVSARNYAYGSDTNWGQPDRKLGPCLKRGTGVQ